MILTGILIAISGGLIIGGLGFLMGYFKGHEDGFASGRSQSWADWVNVKPLKREGAYND